ncbi:hypothetical protein, partial [Sansalvadorimonas verongulae]|uniref:hypothetical protein n=1 Tax=Sansalvadorimonas verongulae TaxID=2172824 RepID=UPI001E61ADFF
MTTENTLLERSDLLEKALHWATLASGNWAIATAFIHLAAVRVAINWASKRKRSTSSDSYRLYSLLKPTNLAPIDKNSRQVLSGG